MKNVLHVGCGGHHILGQHGFSPEEWREIRLDINPAVKPDIIGTITNMRDVPDDSIDAVFSSHNLEHLYAHEVPKALAEFRRVLRDDGFCLIIVPDIQPVAAMVAEGGILDTAYQSSAGPITPLDIMYGHRPSLAQGNLYMAHHTAFTRESLRKQLSEYFLDSLLQSSGFTLVAFATNGSYKTPYMLDIIHSFFGGKK